MSHEPATFENGVTDLLSIEEEEFVLAVIECGGNLSQAYRSVFAGNISNPGARARAILQRPEVARRLAQLQGSVTESHLVTVESHLVELAVIRDLAKAQGQLKVALNAEECRGKVIGLYQTKQEDTTPKTVSHLQRLAERVEAMLPGNKVEDAVVVGG